jgi:SAM-dependent methyltransferase
MDSVPASVCALASEPSSMPGFKRECRSCGPGPAAVLLWAVLVAACAGAEEGQPPGADVYQSGPASRDGIGKFYLGREISHVMGHLGAGWLERPEREREERTDLLLRNLPVSPGDVVADLGAGTGYFALPMAGLVGPGGKVLAVDIQPEMLTIVAERVAERGIDNIETILATETDPRLPPDTVDLVLIVDAYHEFSHPREVMQGVVRGLRPGGRLILIEYRGEDPRVPIKALHKMTAAQAKREMAAVGLEWVETLDFLPQQHFLVFAKPRR